MQRSWPFAVRKFGLAYLRMPRLKARLGMVLFCASILSACHSSPPITRDALVGSYIYKSEDPEGRPSDHAYDHLTLQPDGKYILIQGGPTKPRSEVVGVWRITPAVPSVLYLK